MFPFEHGAITYLRLEAREAGHRVGPGVEAVPRPVHVVDVGIGAAVDAVLREQVHEALAVEHVEDRPRPTAAPDLLHRRVVEAAPVLGEADPVDAGSVPERRAG